MKINSHFSSHSLDERLFIASLYERRVLELNEVKDQVFESSKKVRILTRITRMILHNNQLEISFCGALNVSCDFLCKFIAACI